MKSILIKRRCESVVKPYSVPRGPVEIIQKFKYAVRKCHNILFPQFPSPNARSQYPYQYPFLAVSDPVGAKCKCISLPALNAAGSVVLCNTPSAHWPVCSYFWWLWINSIDIKCELMSSNKICIPKRRASLLTFAFTLCWAPGVSPLEDVIHHCPGCDEVHLNGSHRDLHLWAFLGVETSLDAIINKGDETSCDDYTMYC